MLGLDTKRFRLSVAVSCRRDPDFTRDIALFREHGIAVYEIPMWRRPAPLRDLQAVCRLVRLCRRIRPDIVHAHSSKAGFIGRLAGRLAGVPSVIYTPHAFSWEMRRRGVLRVLFRMLERVAVPWTDHLIAVSEHEKQLALGLGFPESRVTVIPNGVPVDERGGGAPASSRTAQGGGVTIGFVGRLCRQKGADLFFAVVPAMIAACPSARFLVVAGEGSWGEKIRGFVSRQPWRERVIWRQACDEVEVSQSLTEMDLLLMPSRWEGCPYTLLEAMQAGVPVVATRVGGIPELLRDGTDGLLVADEDAVALAEATIRLAGDEALRRTLAASARKRVAIFALERMLTRTASLYEALAPDG
jgi:glycosyltransferase involved in cell wall biosynthesis